MDVTTNMVGFRTMAWFSTKKLLLNRRWVIVALVAGLVALIMGYAATQHLDRLSGGSDLLNLLVLSFFLPVMAMIYGASMIRNEIDDRSITPVVTSSVDRRVSYFGYYVSLIAVLVAMLLIVNTVGWSAYFLQMGVDSEAVGLLLTYSVILVVGAVVYSTLFLVMGVVLKQPMYLGLFYAFVWEGFIGSLPGAVGELTIKHQLSVLASNLVSYGSIANMEGNVVVSAVALAVVTIVLLVLGALTFREKELP